MKEASGELSMTAIAVVAIAAVAGIFYTFVWPMIQASIVQNTCKTMGDGYVATKGKVAEGKAGCFAANEDDAGGSAWYCCPGESN